MPATIKGSIAVWTKSQSTSLYFEVSGWIETRDIVSGKGSELQRNNSGDCSTELVYRLANDPNDPSSFGGWTAFPRAPSGNFILTDGASPIWGGDWAAMGTVVKASRYIQLGVRAANTSDTTLTEMCLVDYIFEFKSC